MGSSMTRPRGLIFSAVGVPVSACLVGAGVALASGLAASSLFVEAQVGVVVFPLVLGTRWAAQCRQGVRSGRGMANLGGIILCFGTLLAVSLSGWELLSGRRTSKLAEIGVHVSDLKGDVTRAYLIFLLCVGGYAVGQFVARRARPSQASGRKRETQEARSKTSMLASPMTYLVLVGFSIAAKILHPGGSQQVVFSSRGLVQGNGIFTTLSWGAALAAVLGLVHHHWGSRLLAIVTLASMVWYVAISSSRSPLVVAGIAILVRLGYAASLRRMAGRALVGILLVVYLGSALAIAVSGWRGEIVRHQPASFLADFGDALKNPLGRLSGGVSASGSGVAGVDTLDGLVLAEHVDRGAVGASVFDPLKAVANLLPRQLWPSKPDWLSDVVTHYYTSFSSGSGIFLSGPGYLLIVTGSVWGAVVAFGLVGFAAEELVQTFATPSVWLVILCFCLMEFFFGGDAFVVFHALSLCIDVLAAWAIASLLYRLQVMGVEGMSRTERRLPDAMINDQGRCRPGGSTWRSSPWVRLVARWGSLSRRVNAGRSLG